MSSPTCPEGDDFCRRKYRYRRNRAFDLIHTHSYQYLEEEINNTNRSKRKFIEMSDPYSLHRAVYQCDEDVVAALVSSGFDINTLNEQCDAPAHIAAAKGYFHLFRYLVENKANASICDKHRRTPLHLVAEHGNPDENGLYFQLAEFIIGLNVNVNAPDASKHTPLHMAAKSCSYDIADLLLQHGANVNFANFEGKTPLHFAIFKQNPEIVNLMLTYGADPRIRCNNGFTCLYYALRAGSSAIIEALLDFGAPINDKISLRTTLSVNIMCRPCLHMAIERNNVEIVKLLLSRNADICAQDELGNGPLHVAAKAGRDQMIKLLLAIGANINQIDGRGVTPLYVALENGRDRIFELLLQQGAKWTSRGQFGFTMLHSAIKYRNPNLFRILLSKDKISLESQDLLGRTPLHHAVEDRNLSYATMLLEHGAPVNAKCKAGKTPLHMAVEAGRSAVYKILIQHGADVNAMDTASRTPLHYAMFRGCYMAVDILLAYNADINAVNTNGETPLHVAIKFRQIHLIELLIKYKVDLTIPDSLGYSPLHLCVIHEHANLSNSSAENTFFWTLMKNNVDVEVKTVDADEYTPLHLAAKRGYADSAKQLLLHGADVNSLDKKKSTPLHLAVEAGHTDCIEQLLLHNANVEALDYNKMIPIYYSLSNRIDKVFERYRIKRILAGFKVVDFMYECIWSEDEDEKREEKERSEFIDQCCTEIEKLKNGKLSENLSFYEFMRLPIRLLVKYVNKPEIIDVFEQNHHRECFPIYAEMLEKSYLTGKRYGDYMDKATTTLFITTSYKFNEDIIDNIAMFFNLKELKNLVHLDMTAVSEESQTES